MPKHLVPILFLKAHSARVRMVVSGSTLGPHEPRCRRDYLGALPVAILAAGRPQLSEDS